MASDTDYLLLRATAEAMKKEYEHRRDEQWHDGESYTKVTWRADRLDKFMDYIRLVQEFQP